MPFAYRLDVENKIFYQLIYGHCTFADLFSPSLKPELNPANRPRVKFIIDNLLGNLETDNEGLNFFVKSMEELKKTGFQLEPTAFLTTKKGISIFIKSLELLVDDETELHQVFSSLDEAIVWLGETDKAQAIYQIRDELLQELQTQHGELV
ncbi:MAG: hypothetical protein U0Z26_09670 [Anaerolineales bacterium]